jgi:hypothetical protein
MDDEPFGLVLVEGRCRIVACARRPSGRFEAKDYLDSLPRKEQQAFGLMFERIADLGVLAENRFKSLKNSGGIFEFRGYDHRIACFLDGSTWLLTHGFSKTGRKPNAQIARAQQIRGEYFELKQRRGESAR